MQLKKSVCLPSVSLGLSLLPVASSSSLLLILPPHHSSQPVLILHGNPLRVSIGRKKEFMVMKGKRKASGAMCYAAPLSVNSLQWISTISSAVLLLAKGTAVQKSFLVPLFLLQAPATVVSWIKGEYGIWAAFLALLGRLFFIPAELELPLTAFLQVIVAPYQVLKLRGRQEGAIISLVVAAYLAIQQFSRIGSLERSFGRGSSLPPHRSSLPPHHLDETLATRYKHWKSQLHTYFKLWDDPEIGRLGGCPKEFEDRPEDCSSMGKVRVRETGASSSRSTTGEVNALKEEVTTLKGQLAAQGEHMRAIVLALQMSSRQIPMLAPNLAPPSTS